MRSPIRLLLALLMGPNRWARQQLRKHHPSLNVAGTVTLLDEGELRIGRDVVVSEHAKLLVPAAAQLDLGDHVYIGRDVELGPGRVIRLGERVSLQDRCVLVGDVDIGRYSLLSLNVLISSGRHYHRHQPHLLIRDQDQAVLSSDEGRTAHSQPVSIGEDCWLGVNAVVMPGVRIGRGAVVGANSVVTRDVEPYTVVAGAPAKPIGQRLEFCPPTRIVWDNPLDYPYFYSGFDMAADQRKSLHSQGGLVARSGFELWVAHSGTMIHLKVRSIGPGGSRLSRGDIRWELPGEWTFIQLPCSAGPLRFEASGAPVAVAEVWTS